MSTPSSSRAPEGRAEAGYLCTARAVRECAERAYARALASELDHFSVDESRLATIAERVVATIRSTYGDPSRIPYHARWRHFDAGGTNRNEHLHALFESRSPEERLISSADLVVTSVLLDAGAGEHWSYVDENGSRLRRSEGLAVASFRGFIDGTFSSQPKSDPLRVDAARLAAMTDEEVGVVMQVGPDNPLVGLSGRAELLRRLGRVALASADVFGTTGRIGGFVRGIVDRAKGAGVRASDVLGVVLDALRDVWPGGFHHEGTNLGDVWPHPRLGLVPFHKLSQWLTYSLFEPLEWFGLVIEAPNELTGLAEYRNGGLFIDGGALIPKSNGLLTRSHPVGSSEVVEWRALTVALLDRTAIEVRALFDSDEEALPLAKVLEGGTWSTGRALAFERRPDGSPPMRVESDGTVF